MMLSKHIQETVPLAAGAICLLLAGIVWMPLNQTPTFNDKEQDTQSAEDAQAVIDDQLSAGALELLQRPLFHITRRPPEVAAAPVPAPVIVTLSLTGVINSDNVEIALMRLSNRPELFRAQVGDRVGDWTVTDITESAVSVLKSDGTEQTISLNSGN